MSNEGFGAASGAKGAKATLLGQWAKFGVQLTSTIVLARLLSPTDFGQFSMIVAFAGLATLLGDFGLSSATMQSKSLSDQQRSNLFWINFAIGLLCSIAIYLCAPVIAAFYAQPSLQIAIQGLAPTFLFQAAISQLTANAARSLKFKLLAQIDVSAQLVGFIVAFTLATAGAGVSALVAQQVAIAAWTLLVLSVAGRWIPRIPRKAEMASLLRFGTNSFLVQLLTYLSSNVDSILIGKFWGPGPLGLYDRAFQLYKMPVQQIATPLTRVVLPLLSRRQDDRAWVSDKLVQIQKIVAYSVGGIFVIIASTAVPVVGVLLGENWLPAGPILSVLAVGGVFQAIGYVYYWAFLITNQTGVQLRASIVTRTVMIALIAAGVLLGPIGVAIAVAAGLLSNWLILSRWAMKATKLNVRLLVIAALRPLTIHVLANVPSATISVVYSGVIPLLSLLFIQLASIVLMYLLIVTLHRGFRDDIRSIIKILRSAF